MRRISEIAGRVAACFEERTAAAGLAERVADDVLSDVREAYDPYHGASWVARWRVEAVDESGDVARAKLVKVSGGNDDSTRALGFGGVAVPARAMETVGPRVAVLVKGRTVAAKAVFGWQKDDFWFSNGRDAKPYVGAEFDSESDSFERGVDAADGKEEAVVKVRVTGAKYRDGELAMRMRLAV